MQLLCPKWEMLELKPRELVEVTTKTLIAFFFFFSESRLLWSEFFLHYLPFQMGKMGIEHVNAVAS